MLAVRFPFKFRRSGDFDLFLKIYFFVSDGYFFLF